MNSLQLLPMTTLPKLGVLEYLNLFFLFLCLSIFIKELEYWHYFIWLILFLAVRNVPTATILAGMEDGGWRLIYHIRFMRRRLKIKYW
ncbi:hypothetical protein GGI43DRAFT_163950 [Trichoderma evansii]